jgi:hypothetical protein
MPDAGQQDQEVELTDGTADHGLVRRVGDAVRRPSPIAARRRQLAPQPRRRSS